VCCDKSQSSLRGGTRCIKEGHELEMRAMSKELLVSSR